MSKTIASTLCETNQMRGLPQENVFIQNLYRYPTDYGAPFQRSATSTAPVQICAVASAQGDDTIGAMALQEVMKILSGMAAQAQTRSVLDFENFVNHFIASANSAVCNLSISNRGAAVRVSITLLIIEGDTMRIVSVGNTRAVLIRQNRVINLSDDQTVAHRYVQMGAIPAEAESSHPERTVLTQYLGKFHQDGPVLPEKQIYMKLADGDEICLLGTGISQGLSDYLRNSVLIKPVSLELKANELVGRCAQNNIKGGLSVLLLRVESTLLMPAGAYMPAMGNNYDAGPASSALSPAQNPAYGQESLTPAYNQAPASTYTAFPENTNQNSLIEEDLPDPSDDPQKLAAARKKARTLAVIRPIAVFLGCILVGYLGVMFLFNVGNLMKPASTAATDQNGAVASLNKVMYVTEEMVALYSDPSLNNAPAAYLNRGDVVTLSEVSGSFSKVVTVDNKTGYVISTMLSDTDPTIGESQAEMSADPTPIPSQEQTAVTTSGASETKVSETTAPSETTPTPTVTPSVTPDPSASSVTPSVTPDPSASVTPEITPDPGATVTPAPDATLTPTLAPTAAP